MKTEILNMNDKFQPFGAVPPDEQWLFKNQKAFESVRNGLRDAAEGKISNPDFHKAVIEAQTRLRNGTAEWHTFEEVFGTA